MRKKFKNLLKFVVVSHMVVCFSQDISSPQPPKKEPINVGWFPKTVNFAPDESNLIVTACTDTWKSTTRQRCTVMRYWLDAKRWEALPEIDMQANYNDVAYTWDGKAIFAHEHAECEVV